MLIYLLFICFCGCCFDSNRINYIETLITEDVTKSCFVLNANNFSALQNSQANKYVKTNNKYFIYVNKTEIVSWLQKDFDYVEFDYSNITFKDFYKKLKFIVFKREELLNKKVYYAYSSKLKKYIILNSVKINLQFVEQNNNLKVGYPMIYTSF